MISMLLNAIHYFLDCVVIIHAKRQYRLVVFHLDNVLLDKRYTSLKGAKIAFQRFYRHQACIGGTKPRWDEYIPERYWIEKKMVILDRKAPGSRSDQRGDMQGQMRITQEFNNGKL